MKKKKLLIVDKHQFGYLTDVYQWCKYLSSIYDITVISADVGDSKFSIPGVRVFLVNFKLPRTIRALLFILTALIYVAQCNGVILVEYFQGCSILKKVFRWKRMMVDVRTLSVSPDKAHRDNYNKRLQKDLKDFDEVIAISEGVIKQMNISNVHLLPLGADCISMIPKTYNDELRLLYVGTFRWRNLEDTIEGVKLFHESNPTIKISYDMVGAGEVGQVEKFKLLAKELGLEHIITLHGQIPYTELKPFFDKCNIGISYVPMTDYYDCQPPTKTYEYILSGLFCIATATTSNRELITRDNGLLIKDNAKDFALGLEQYLKIKNDLNDTLIRQSLADSTWKRIVADKLLPILRENKL